MVRTVRSNPENIYVATDYKKIGKSFELNRLRVTNLIASIGRANTAAQKERIDDLVGTDGVTDAEKPALKRELDAIIRDFEYLGTDTRNAELGDTDEYYAVLEAYGRVVGLMSKIVNSVGTYKNPDVYYLTPYYTDYTEKAIILENMILTRTAELDRIASYQTSIHPYVNIYPEAIGMGETTNVRASVLYDGVERVDDVSADSIVFIVSGVSDTATAADFTSDDAGFSITFFDDFTIGYDTYIIGFNDTAIGYTTGGVGRFAIITGCKSFNVAYNAIAQRGMLVDMTVTFDTDAMPF